MGIFLTRINNEIDLTSDSNASEVPAKTNLVNEADQEIIDYLKRLQNIKLTRRILALCSQAQTPADVNESKRAGVDSIIDLPATVSAKLSSLDTTFQESLKNFNEIKEADAEELNKKYKLVVPPNGLEISLVITLVVAAITMLAFVILKAEDMLDSSVAYWGFLTAGILILLGINAVIINLIKVLRFKKDRKLILAAAKRKYIENADVKHSRLKTKIEDESFKTHKKEYSKAAALKLHEIDKEEQSIMMKLCT